MSHPLIATTLDILFPPRCPSCRESVFEQGTLCPACWKEVHFIAEPCCARCGHPFELQLSPDALCGVCLAEEPPYTMARSALRYNEASSKEVAGFKFHDRTGLAPMFGLWMARAGAPFLAQAEVIIPVPLHPWRLLRRRYNQAALLAYALSRHAKLPVLPDGLVRRKNTKPQTGLTRAQRLENVQGAFAVNAKRKSFLEGKKVVLVDDVMTTGATLHACSKALKKAGTSEVYVLTVARTVVGD
jgi:ComF family protein